MTCGVVLYSTRLVNKKFPFVLIHVVRESVETDSLSSYNSQAVKACSLNKKLSSGSSRNLDISGNVIDISYPSLDGSFLESYKNLI
uniref:Uncharacterized protein n=1 Tax=Heterorhabditis bacteriophora TaxID=37862 RepID=A0A1I7WGM2_HETBA